MILDLHGEEATHPPQPGDVILSARLAYEVTAARPVESRLWPDRWCITTRRIGRHGPDHLATGSQIGRLRAGGGRVIEMSRYERGERPADHRCGAPDCRGCAGG